MIFKRESRRTPPAGQDRPITLPARTVLVAAGTTPNITYEKETRARSSSTRRRSSSSRTARSRERRRPVPSSTPDAERLLHLLRARRHASSPTTATTIPRYAGNVVKAMASAKDGYPHVVELFARGAGGARSGGAAAARRARGGGCCQRLDDELIAVVEDVVRLTPTIVEVIVKAPAAARQFHPGQFYRLQNYESVAPRVDGHDAAADGGHRADRRVGRQGEGLLSLIALELGVSSRLVRVPARRASRSW